MTFAALIAGIRAMDEEIARLRAHVAALTTAPATTTEPGLDLDARVPCASCGGEFTWTTSDEYDQWSAMFSARCRCGNEWDGVPDPVTWRTLATSGAEVPAAYVARLVSEVDRLRALLAASAPSSTAAPHSGAEPTVEAGALLHGALRALAAAGHFVEFCYHPDAERGDGTGWVLVIGDTHNYGDLDTLAAHAVKRAGEVSNG